MEKSNALIDEKRVHKNISNKHFEWKSKHKKSKPNINWKLEYINHFYVEQISILTGKEGLKLKS